MNIPSIAIAGVNNLLITGAGPATRLRMLGPGYKANWRLIDIREGSPDISIRDMTLDGTLRKDTAEQTHLLHVDGPVSNITAERIGFYLPSFEAGVPVVPPVIQDNNFGSAVPVQP